MNARIYLLLQSHRPLAEMLFVRLSARALVESYFFRPSPARGNNGTFALTRARDSIKLYMADALGIVGVENKDADLRFLQAAITVEMR